MKARTLWMTEPGRIEVRDVEVGAPGHGELQVRMNICGICAWDSYLFRGKSLVDDFPFRFGHEGVGVIVAVGPGVSDLNEGDNVFCAGGAPSMAEVINMPRTSVTPIPADIEDYSLWIGEPVACVVNSLDLLSERPGDHVVVVGSGYMGLLHIQGLARMPVGRITAFDIDEKRLALARQFGADEALLIGSGEADRAIERIKSEGGADVTIECSSVQSGLDLSAQLLRRGGLMSLFAWHRGERTIDGTLWHVNGLRMVNSSPASDPHFSERLPQTARLIERGVFDQRELITHVRPFTEAQRMMEIATNKENGYIKGAISFDARD